MWWENILKLRIHIWIRLVNWQILMMAEGSTYIHEFETGEKAEYPNNPNPRKEKRTYSLFKIYSKNFTCHNRWNTTGEGLIERAFDFKYVKRMETDKISSNICGKKLQLSRKGRCNFSTESSSSFDVCVRTSPSRFHFVETTFLPLRSVWSPVVMSSFFVIVQLRQKTGPPLPAYACLLSR